MLDRNYSTPSVEIERIRIPLGERFADLWLYTDSDSVTLFDSGVAGTLNWQVKDQLSSKGLSLRDVSSIVVSHLDVDHSGDVGFASTELPETAVIAHELDSDAMESMDAFMEQRGQEFALNWGVPEGQGAIDWMESAFSPGKVSHRIAPTATQPHVLTRNLEIWHLPGHSLGHLAIYSPENRVLAISDAILGAYVPLTDGTPAFPPTYRHVDSYVESIRRVNSADPSVLLTAHYGDFVGDEISDFLSDSLNFVDTVESAVLESLGSGRKTLAQIIQVVNPQIATWPVEGTATALAFPVAGHLERALSQGRVTRTTQDGVWAWETT